MAGLFNDLIPKEKKIPDNIQVNQSMFSDLLPSEDKHQFKITDKGNPGSNLSINDATEPGLFDDLVPQVNKVAPENKNKSSRGRGRSRSSSSTPICMVSYLFLSCDKPHTNGDRTHALILV